MYVNICSDREDTSSMATAGATAITTEENSRASRESGLLCSHSHGESISRKGYREIHLCPWSKRRCGLHPWNGSRMDT